MAVEKVYCPSCNKTMAATNFYTYKDKTKSDLCKSCLTMMIDNRDESTFLWLLEKFDVPYIKAEWDVLRNRAEEAYRRDPKKIINGMSVFGKYLSKMKLNQYNKYSWADTEMLAEMAAKEAEEHANPNAKSEEDIAKMREAYERGDITEYELKTYEAQHQPITGIYDATLSLDNQDDFARSGGRQVADVDIPDVGLQLEEEDKIYLATKWGIYYTPQEWLSLEKLYDEFMQSFDIQGAARIDTLKLICKSSLKINQAIDSGDVDSSQKYAKMYDSLMKSAKFTEAQRKEEKSGDFDAVGQVVYFAEKVKGKIERYDTSEPYDNVDKKMDNLKRYTKELIMNDSALAQDIENFMMRTISTEEQKKDREKAKEEGKEYVELTDENFKEYSEFLEAEEIEDNES